MTLVVMSLFGREILAAVRKAVEQASGGAVALDPHLFEPPLWFTVIFNYALPIAVLAYVLMARFVFFQKAPRVSAGRGE